MRAGAEAIGAKVVDFGLLTTPQLHFIVREFNLGRNTWASERGYVAAAFVFPSLVLRCCSLFSFCWKEAALTIVWLLCARACRYYTRMSSAFRELTKVRAWLYSVRPPTPSTSMYTQTLTSTAPHSSSRALHSRRRAVACLSWTAPAA